VLKRKADNCPSHSGYNLTLIWATYAFFAATEEAWRFWALQHAESFQVSGET
jgi:hypothetical protein